MTLPKPRLATTGNAIVALCTCLAACSHLAGKDKGADAGPPATAGSAGAAGTGSSTANGAPSLLSGGAFEGDISLTLTPEGKPPEIMFFEVKGDKVRFVMTPSVGDIAYVITNYATGESTSISDTKKTATLMNMSKLWAKAPQKDIGPVPTARDVVAGYACDVYRLDDGKGEKGEACVAKGIRFPQLANDPWLSSLGDVFPMRVDRTDATGKKSHMEVTKVEKKTLGDALFAVPAGYKTVNLDDLMGKPRGTPR
jgi:hypothetical protein